MNDPKGRGVIREQDLPRGRADGCDHCGAPITNGLVLCRRCQETARCGLENVAAYHADLFSLGGQRTPIRVRRAEVNDPTGRAVALVEVIEQDPADQAAADTKAMLVGWARILLSDRPEIARAAQPRDTVAGLTSFLSRYVTSIAALEWGEEFLRELLALERRLRHIVEGAAAAGTPASARR